MITIMKSNKLAIPEMKQTQRWVSACMEVSKDPVKFYMLGRSQIAPPTALLVGKVAYDALVAALDSEKTLAIKTNAISLEMASAGLRAEEVLRLVSAISIFPGNEEVTQYKSPYDLGGSGTERKTLVSGTRQENLVETSQSADGGVVADYPIANEEIVSARKAGGPLDVVDIPDLNLGFVELEDSESPIAEGVAVELAYQATNHTVYNLTDAKKNVVAVVLSTALYDYLLAND